MRKINCIGILTSGGDAPGMNAAIRAVTRAGIANGFRIMAIYRGYEGLINDDIAEFTTENVSNIIQRGGTILKTARSKEFETVEGRQKAYENMQKRGIDALVVSAAVQAVTILVRTPALVQISPSISACKILTYNPVIKQIDRSSSGI